jgi:hypothetical protein
MSGKGPLKDEGIVVSVEVGVVVVRVSVVVGVVGVSVDVRVELI